MTRLPSAEALYDAIDGTWPAARQQRLGPLALREGRGGGQRVSATSASGPATAEELDAAEAAMAAMAQPALFQIRDGQEALDAALAARGYAIVDPVNLHAGTIASLTDVPVPPVTVIPVWEPLAIMRDIWAAGGIGPGRLAVMARAAGPKTALIARWNDHPGGCAFVAIHERIAMLHALEILPHQRGQGLGKWMMRRAAFWARDNGADVLAVACTQANTAANALYASLGMTLVGQYHYRKWKDEQ